MSHLRVVGKDSRNQSSEPPVWRHPAMRGNAALIIFLVSLVVICIGLAIMANYDSFRQDPRVYLGVGVAGALLVTWIYLKLCEALDPSDLA